MTYAAPNPQETDACSVLIVTSGQKTVSLFTELLQPEGGRVTAKLGEDLDPEMPGLCIVCKRYLAGGGLTGTMAIIGSSRMPFQKLIPILDYFTGKLGQSMSGKRQEDQE